MTRFDPPGFDLAAPGTFLFDGAASARGRRLNAFALGLKRPANRARFLADEAGYMREAGLDDAERALVAARDWTGMLRAGGHLQAILKLAATLGLDIYHIGAHNCGVTRDAMEAACPRLARSVDGLDG